MEATSAFKKKKATGRKNIFVLIPDVPKLLADMPANVNDQKLVSFGENTLSNLLKEKDISRKVMPKVLFLTDKENSPTINPQHFLSTYSNRIAAEKQLPAIFHIASHGDPNRLFTDAIGFIDANNGISINDFAKRFDELYSQNNEILRDKPIEFVFHTCNSAYCHLTKDMHNDEVKQRISSFTLIGKFYQAMTRLGYKKITVSGFRGFYHHLKSKGSLVTSSTQANCQHMFAANSAKFTIKANGNIILPTQAYFSVPDLENEHIQTWKKPSSHGNNKHHQHKQNSPSSKKKPRRKKEASMTVERKFFSIRYKHQTSTSPLTATTNNGTPIIDFAVSK